MRITEIVVTSTRVFEMHVRLAVLAGEPLTFEAARNPHARLSIAQPAAAILSQKWMFSQGELTPLPAAMRR